MLLRNDLYPFKLKIWLWIKGVTIIITLYEPYPPSWWSNMQHTPNSGLYITPNDSLLEAYSFWKPHTSPPPSLSFSQVSQMKLLKSMVIVRPLLLAHFPAPPFMLFFGTALPFSCVDLKAKVKGAFQGMSTLRDTVLSCNSGGVLNEPELAVPWRDKGVIWMKASHLDLGV